VAYVKESPTLTLALPDGFSSVGILLNHRCSVHDEDGVIVVWVDSQVWLTFDADDVVATRLAMAQLSMHSVATQAEIASAFGVGTATVERACKASRQSGVEGLVDKRRPGRVPRIQGAGVDKAVLAAVWSGQSVRAIAVKLGVSRTAVDTSLARSGWSPEDRQQRLDIAVPGGETAAVSAGRPVDGAQKPAREPAQAQEPSRPAEVCPESVALPAEFTADSNPSERSIDRLLAREGHLYDAAPLFEDAVGVSDLGAMLAIPVLVQQGVFVEAMRVFSSIGPAFYGLRTVVACLSLLMVLSLSRLQDVMKREPGQLGRLLGLDRSPEVKTLRRKLRTLAAQKTSLAFMGALARRQLATQHEIWAYVDGHVAVYTGKHKLREHHVASLRAARPSMIDYWVNQTGGAPLLVVTGPEHEGLVHQLRAVLQELDKLAPGKTITIIFDREGWSPKLFAELADNPRVRFLTYLKANKQKKLPRLSITSFRTVHFELAGESISYELADTRVRVPYKLGKEKRVVELRQITLRKPNGKQVHIVTGDFERPAAELAYRMTHRWSQENFFKYDRAHRGIDALVTQDTEPAADGGRLVKNPQRAALDASIAKLGQQLNDALQDYGRRQQPGSTEPCSESHQAYIEALTKELLAVRARRAEMPSRVPFVDTEQGRDAVQPNVEVRRLMHTFRMLADRAELALLELIRPHFSDWRHEGRSLLRAILHSPGNITVTGSELHLQIAPQASPYKTRALQALCDQLTSMQAVFPGSGLRMVFSVLQGRTPS
jgi:transposase